MRIKPYTTVCMLCTLIYHIVCGAGGKLASCKLQPCMVQVPAKYCMLGQTLLRAPQSRRLSATAACAQPSYKLALRSISAADKLVANARCSPVTPVVAPSPFLSGVRWACASVPVRCGAHQKCAAARPSAYGTQPCVHASRKRNDVRLSSSCVRRQERSWRRRRAHGPLPPSCAPHRRRPRHAARRPR